MAFTDTAGASGTTTPHDPDDISLFLRQLLHRSSSSSSSASPHPPPLASTSTPMMPPSTFPFMGKHAPDQQLHCYSSLPIPGARTLHQQIPSLSAFFSGSDRLSVDRTSDDALPGVVWPSPSGYLPAADGSNLSSESLTGSVPMRRVDNEYGEECDCESEERAEEAENHEHPPRSQSKRSRAAEVHNLSEKRRRSRINEKMKALQTLIPNSNKTDKASMLDEAIEYLKQLQLQVQMLSLRNGLSLHPMSLPGVSGILHPSELSQMGMDFSNRGISLDINLPNELNMTSTTSHTMFNPIKQCLSSARPSLPSVSSVINSEPASYGLESCIQDNFGPFQLHNYPQAGCRDQNMSREQVVPGNTQAKSPEKTLPISFDTRDSSIQNGIEKTMPLSFDMRDSDVKGENPLEVRSQRKYGLQEMLP